MSGEANEAEKPKSRLRDLIDLLTVALAISVFVSTLVSLAARQNWVADLLANLRVQQVIGLIVVLVLCLVVRRWKTAVLCFVFLIYHGTWLKDWHSVTPLDVTPGKATLTVTSVNVWTGNQHHDLILDHLRQCEADVFAVLEMSSIQAKKLEETFSKTHPHRVLRPSDTGNFGLGFFSKHKIVDQDVFTFNTEIESIAITISPSGDLPESVRIYATHPLPPMGPTLFEQRNDHLVLLADRVERFRKSAPDVPVIVLGDLNLTPWSPIFEDFLDRTQLSRGDFSMNFSPTWYRGRSFALGLVIDHVLLDSRFFPLAHNVGPQIGSDHRSVTVKMVSRNP